MQSQAGWQLRGQQLEGPVPVPSRLARSPVQSADGGTADVWLCCLWAVGPWQVIDLPERQCPHLPGGSSQYLQCAGAGRCRGAALQGRVLRAPGIGEGGQEGAYTAGALGEAS